MTLESSLWTNLKGVLPIEAHAVRIENSVELGTPDVNLCIPRRLHEGGLVVGSDWDGWVELKVLEAPKRRATLFRCPHFTMEQRQWLSKRTQAGGKAYLLLQVGQPGKKALPGSGKYMWIRGDIAAVWIGHCTLTELLGKCEWVGNSLMDLVEYLQK